MKLSQPSVFVLFHLGGARYQNRHIRRAKGKHYRKEYSKYRGGFTELNPADKAAERRSARRIAKHKLQGIHCLEA